MPTLAASADAWEAPVVGVDFAGGKQRQVIANRRVLQADDSQQTESLGAAILPVEAS